MAYDTTTLTGTYLRFDGTPEAGTIEIIPSVRFVVDAVGDEILTGRIKVELDAEGSFSVALPSTDDESLNPTGFGYTLVAKLRHQHLAAFSFSLPASPATVDVADITPVLVSSFTPSTTYVEQADLDALTAVVATKATTEALDAETTARLAETTARIAADAVLDGRLTTLEDAIPGTELGFAELTTDFTTTNTTNTSVTDGPGAGGVIPSFSIGPIVGTGRPVKVEFHAPQVRHTTASAFVNAYLIVNGVAQSTSGQNSLSDSPATNIGRELNMHRRLVLADGVPYTFKIGIQGGVAGTVTLDADTTATRAELSVIAR